MAKPRSEGITERVRELYAKGFSSRGVAKELGISKTYAHYLLEGDARSRSESLKGPRILNPTHWRTCRQRARKIMEAQLERTLECNEHVHHIDGDFTNNALENLEVLSARDHMHIHHPYNPIPKWKRPGVREYMKDYLKEYWERKKLEQNY